MPAKHDFWNTIFKSTQPIYLVRSTVSTLFWSTEVLYHLYVHNSFRLLAACILWRWWRWREGAYPIMKRVTEARWHRANWMDRLVHVDRRTSLSYRAVTAMWLYYIWCLKKSHYVQHGFATGICMRQQIWISTKDAQIWLAAPSIKVEFTWKSWPDGCISRRILSAWVVTGWTKADRSAGCGLWSWWGRFSKSRFPILDTKQYFLLLTYIDILRK